MATINSLPLELLDQILAELVDPFPSSWTGYRVTTPSTISVDLHAASLVCRAWRYSAQANLFRSVIIPNNGVTASSRRQRARGTPPGAFGSTASAAQGAAGVRCSVKSAYSASSVSVLCPE